MPIFFPHPLVGPYESQYIHSALVAKTNQKPAATLSFYNNHKRLIMTLNKKILFIAVSAALAPGLSSAAEGLTVSGFADIIYTIKNESRDNTGDGTDTSINDANSKFGATAEADFAYKAADSVSVNVDLDLNAGGGDSGQIEQAYFGWAATPAVTVLGGIFNDPIGYDAEDAPNMNFTSHDVIYGILDHQTALTGDNVAGIAVAGAIGPVTLTGAMLNETAQTNEENSFAIVANYTALKDLNLELSYLTQADQATRDKNGGATIASAGDVVDFNAAYSINNFIVGLDYLVADKIVDSAYAMWAGYTFGTTGFGVKARYEAVGWEASGAEDSKRTTLYGSYQVAKNLSAALEIADGDDKNPQTAVTGIAADQTMTLEFIATFN